MSTPFEPPQIPYYAPDNILPGRIPTENEIFNRSTVLRWTHTVNVVLVRDDFVVKFGSEVKLEEGFNAMFVQHATNVPVPTVYALFRKDGENFIVMERIRGESLDGVWYGLDDERKKQVAEQIGNHMTQLRSIPSPAYYGGVGQRCVDPYLTLQRNEESRLDVGPIQREEMWVDAFVWSAETFRRKVGVVEEWIEPLLEAAEQGRPAVFTHGDFHKGNIMLNEKGDVVLIDWEYSGWAPVYWERSLMLIWNAADEWSDAMGEYLGGDTDEVKAVGNIVKWMFLPVD